MSTTQPREPRPGHLELPGYRIEQAAAGDERRGRHGVLYDAVRRSDGTAVQIEVLTLPPGSAEQFRDEAGALLELPHSPQLVAVLDLGVLAAEPGSDVVGCLVSERATRSLADRLDTDGPLTDAEAVSAVTDAALGLVALHGADVLHGALTTAALVELGNGRVALTGVAVPVLEGTAADGATRPPEVRRGGDWSAAGDLWALGAVLRELTGRRPLPAAIDDLLTALLSPDPADRPQDAAAVVERLRAVAAPDPLHTTTPDAPVRTVTGGRPLGSNYLLVEPIGRGATGQVWRGTRRSDGASVAVKVLRSELAEEPEIVTRFVAERSTLTGLTSPYLVRVLDLVAESGTLAIVMELVDGADLRHSLAAGQLTTAEAFRVLAHVAEGLAAVHAAGVVHRDVKPENVLVGRDDGRVRALLTDFGVAGAVAPGPGRRLTRASRLVGTPEYVAPELAAGRAATGAADVYALGVLAYETLSGRRPFDAEHPAALLRAHLEEQPQRPDGMAEDVWAVVAPCLAKDPDERPDAGLAAAAFAALESRAGDAVTLGALPDTSGATPPPYLSPAVASEPHPAALLTSDATRPAAPATPAPPEPGRRRWPWVAALAALVVLGVSAGAWFGRPDPEPTKPKPQASSFQGTVKVPVVVDSPRRGEVRLRFPGGATLDGVQSFFVARDGTVAAQGLGPADEDWTAADLDPGTQHCWAVFAVVESPRPVPTPTAPVEPVCRQADGRSE